MKKTVLGGLLIGLLVGWCARSYVQYHNYKISDAGSGFIIKSYSSLTLTDVIFVGLH